MRALINTDKQSSAIWLNGTCEKCKNKQPESDRTCHANVEHIDYRVISQIERAERSKTNHGPTNNK